MKGERLFPEGEGMSLKEGEGAHIFDLEDASQLQDDFLCRGPLLEVLVQARVYQIRHLLGAVLRYPARSPTPTLSITRQNGIYSQRMSICW